MASDRMIYMANQIAAFFRTQPGGDQAERVAAHLRDFWSPEMRAEPRAHAAGQGEGLDGLVLEAVSLL